MAVRTFTHPDHDVLSAFGLGKLPAEKAREVEEHISKCDPCCITLLDLQSDTFVELVKTSNLEQRQVVNAIGEDAIGEDDSAERSEFATQPKCGIPAGDIPTELASHKRYRLLKLLGRGGMGDVYSAEHLLMNRTVALKVINSEVLSKPTVVERFQREVRAAAKLSHPNIVTAFDAENSGRLHFLVMEYVDGIDLAEFVKQNGPLSVAGACEFISQAANGLQHAHDNGMVHRDIKPHNLMVTPDGHVKILDFGLAILSALPLNESGYQEQSDVPADRSGAISDSLSVGQLTNVGDTMGTPDFISPEQAKDAHCADARSDIYSMGCTLYFLLAGVPPFTEKSAAEKLDAHGLKSPPPIEEIRNDVPLELAVIVRRMMAKHPSKRFQTAAEAAKALTPFSPTTSDKTISRQWTGKNKRSYFARIALATLVIAALVIMSAAFLNHLGDTTIRLAVEESDIEIQFIDRTITTDNDGIKIHIDPGKRYTIVATKKDRTEVVAKTFQLRKGQKVALSIGIDREGRIQFEFDASKVALTETSPPPISDNLSKSKNGVESKPDREKSNTNSPDINESKEFKGVFHSPSSDSTPKVFHSVLQMEVVVSHGNTNPQIEYADGTVVASNGLIATVFEEPGKLKSKSDIESVSVLMLDGSSIETEVLSYEPAYGLAIVRVKDVRLPVLKLSNKRLVKGQRLSWHAVYKNGHRTFLYTRPVRIHKATLAIDGANDLCEIIDMGSSALSAQRSGSALVSHDGRLVALMGRQPHWNVSPKSEKPRTKTAWAIPAHLIAKQLEKLK